MAIKSTADEIKHLNISDSVELSDEELGKLQHTLISILDDIQDVADSNSINYVLGGGSCLGAARHQGMIPWDDDIDINMERSEFEKFIPLFRKKYGDKYWIHVPGKTHDYALLFAHIRLKGTSVKNRDDFNTDECGASVDIFVAENTYSSSLSRNIHGIGCQYYGLMVSCRKFYRDRKPLRAMVSEAGFKMKLKTNIKIFFGLLSAGFSVDKWVKDADNWNSRCKDDSSDFVVFPTGRNHFFGEIYKRSDLFTVTELDFSGRKRKCPQSYDKYLSHMYGADYMKIPEESAREKHIFFKPFYLDN